MKEPQLPSFKVHSRGTDDQYLISPYNVYVKTIMQVVRISPIVVRRF